MAYYRETAPITGYYFAHGLLKSIDGMAPIGAVGQQINEILSEFQVA
jgi:adenylate kinase